MKRGALIGLVIAFAVTRLLIAWLAHNPDVYGSDTTGATGDVDLYESWAEAILDEDRSPYAGVPIEYPPGSLPFIVGPGASGGGEDGYRLAFIGVLMLLDASGLVALLLLARRWGSAAGPALWVFLPASLGPLTYLRLDLVPAVVVLWAFFFASARRWGGAGALLGFGGIVKVFPFFFLPAGAVVARNRKTFVVSAAVTVGLFMLPFLGVMGDLYASVVGYHSERGVQVESLWGSGLFIAARRGYESLPGFNFGALHFNDGVAPALKAIALAMNITIVLVGTWLARRLDRGDVKGYAYLCFAMLASLLATGPVFSPQFLLWQFALASVVACVARSPLLKVSLLLVPVAAMSQLIFPFLYDELAGLQPFAVSVLWVRNLLVVGVAVAAVLTVLTFLQGSRGADESMGSNTPG